MDQDNHRTDERAPDGKEEGRDSVPVLLAKAAALSTAIDGQAALLSAELGRQLAGLHGMQPVAQGAEPASIDPGELLGHAQEAMVATIARLRGLAEGMGVAPSPAAGRAPGDPLGALLDGLAGHAAAQLEGRGGMTAAGPVAAPADVDLKAILSSAQGAHDQALRAAHDLMVGMGLDPADPAAGLAQRMPGLPAAPAAALPTDLPGGDLLGGMQADTQRLQAILGDLFTKIVPPT